MGDCLERHANCSHDMMVIMGENATKTVRLHTPQHMVDKAISII